MAQTSLQNIQEDDNASSSKELKQQSVNKELITSECFISMQKIIRSELKTFDARDSFVLKNSMSMSRRGISMDTSNINDLS